MGSSPCPKASLHFAKCSGSSALMLHWSVNSKNATTSSCSCPARCNGGSRKDNDLVLAGSSCSGPLTFSSSTRSSSSLSVSRGKIRPGGPRLWQGCLPLRVSFIFCGDGCARALHGGPVGDLVLMGPDGLAGLLQFLCGPGCGSAADEATPDVLAVMHAGGLASCSFSCATRGGGSCSLSCATRSSAAAAAVLLAGAKGSCSLSCATRGGGSCSLSWATRSGGRGSSSPCWWS